MKILKFTVMLLTAVFAAFASVGCTVEESQGGDYGYVQFKLYKEASYTPASKAADIGFLGDICKARITLRYQGKTLNQTLVFSAADAQKAEYGLRSEKLQLLAGDYEVVSFAVFDKNDNEGLSVYEIAEPAFSVVANGMTVHDLTVGSQVVASRGNVNFTFVKDMSSMTDVPSTKSMDNHTFDEAKYITVTVERTSNNQPVTFSTIPAKFSIHFNDDENDSNIYPEGYESYKDFGYQTSSLQTDSLLNLVAGDYRVRSYSLLDSYKTSFESRSFDRNSAPTFKIEDNKVQNMCVPVALSKDAPYLQDYYALYEIWKSLDGPNWYYRGENYATGTNWDFNKDPDLWGDQPGVRIHDNGRVASLDITDFGIKGVLSPAIGQLTELVQFYISTHNDINYINTDDPAELSRTRMERHKKYLGESHPLTQLSAPIAFGFKHKKESIPEVALHEKGMSEAEIAALEGFNTAAWLGGGSMKKAVAKAAPVIPQTCGLTELPEEMGKLTKLEFFYVANCPLEKIPSAEAMKNLGALTDIEIYNTPALELTDENIAAIAAMPALVSVNFGENSQWTAEQCEKLFDALAEGPSHDKLQIIYFRNNHLNAMLNKHFSKFPKLGLLDLMYNDIETVEAMGKDFKPVQLMLDYNKIRKFPNNKDGEVFCTIDDIETLSVTHNEMTEFPNIFDKDCLFTIGSVDFSYNNIDHIAEGFVEKGINVKTLSLASNRFTEYPVDFSKSNSKVSIYNFRGNGMRKISKEAFAMQDDIDGEFTVDGDRANFRYTQTFDFSYNRLSDLPVTFADAPFPFLYSVDLSFNAFKEFPFEPLNYTNLTAYALRSQRDDNGKRILSDWPDNLLNHRGLRGFYLGGNDYRRIPENPEERISQLIYYFDISDNPNLEFDASSICTAWRAGAYFLFYDRTQKILNCPQMLN